MAAEKPLKILLTGANGYIGLRILHQLLKDGHEVVCAVRDEKRLPVHEDTRSKLRVVEVDFLEEPKPGLFEADFDIAYYLIHSMSSSTSDFDQREAQAARNFNTYMAQARPRQVIYLSGIVNNDRLSKHLRSRKNVEDILYQGPFSLTVLRAGIIVGSGSSSFEIIRDLCEKLPVMITPRWVLTKTQPIAIRDVIQFLIGVLGFDLLGGHRQGGGEKQQGQHTPSGANGLHDSLQLRSMIGRAPRAGEGAATSRN